MPQIVYGALDIETEDSKGYEDFVMSDLPGEDVALIDGPLQLVQAARRRFKLWMGGLLWNRYWGFPYWRYLGQKVGSGRLRLEARRVLLMDKRLKRGRVRVVSDPQNRNVLIEWEAQTMNNEELGNLEDEPIRQRIQLP